MKYRKKSIIIDAIQWTGENLREIIDFTGLHQSAEKWSWKEYEEVVRVDGLKIFTIEGSLRAPVGWFIIRGVEGEYYPCDPNIFPKLHEPV